MKLWTIQKSCFDITDGRVPFASKEHSTFLNSGLADSRQWVEVYARLWATLGTDQLLWCHTSSDEALSYAQHVRGEYDLWQLDVQELSRHWQICSVGWHWLLQGCSANPPDRLDWLMGVMRKHLSLYYRETYWDDFNMHWRKQTEQERWDGLFIDHLTPGCTHILLPHPIRRSWVVERSSLVSA